MGKWTPLDNSNNSGTGDMPKIWITEDDHKKAVAGTEALDTTNPLDEILDRYDRRFSTSKNSLNRTEAKAKLQQYVDSECRKARIDEIGRARTCIRLDLKDSPEQTIWKHLTNRLIELNTGGNK